jgi:hypothetical protein
MTHHVADGDHRLAAAEYEGVVPVTTDLFFTLGGDVADGDLEMLRLRRLGQQTALQLLGEAPLPLVQAGVLLRQSGAEPEVSFRGDPIVLIRAAVCRSQPAVRQRGPPVPASKIAFTGACAAIGDCYCPVALSVCAFAGPRFPISERRAAIAFREVAFTRTGLPVQ